MESDESGNNLFNSTYSNMINRRNFLSKTIGCTAGLTLLAFPGIITDVLAAKGDKTKEEILKELEQKAGKYMQMYGTCSQASFCSLNDQFELKGDDAVKALKPFAGGIVGRQETCGAVTGSVLALGFFFESRDPKSSEKSLASIQYAAKFFDGFKAEFGSTRCYQVIEHVYGRAYDFQNPEDMKLYMEAAKSGKCVGVVKKAVSIAAEIILENS